MSTIKKNVKLSQIPTNGLRRSILLPALGVATLIVSQIGCSLHFCKNPDCPYRMGYNRTQCQTANHQFSNHTTSSPNIAKTKPAIEQPTIEKPETTKSAYSYQDGVKVGREYAKRFGVTQPIGLTEQLPDALRDSQYGSVFESGCRNGINSFVRERQVSGQPRPAKDLVASPISTKDQAPATAGTKKAIISKAQPEIPEIELPSPEETWSRDDEEVADNATEAVIEPELVADTALPGQDAPVADAEELFAESAPLVSESAELDPIDSMPEPAESEMEIMESSEGLANAPDVEKLFEESRTLQTIEPEVQWQEISPPQDEIFEPHARHEVTTELTPSIDPLEEPKVFELESSVTGNPGLLNPEPAAVPDIENSLRQDSEIVASDLQPSQETPQMDAAAQQPISTPVASKPAKTTKEIKLSATYVPFRRQSPDEPLIESDISTLQSKNTTSRGQDGEVRLRAVPAYQINNRVPKFRPSQVPFKTTQVATPKPHTPEKTGVPARSISSSVLVENLDSQEVKLNREPTLTATPFTRLNRDLNQLPISTSSATWQGSGGTGMTTGTIGGSTGTIQSESSENYFVPTDPNNVPIFRPRKEDMIDSPILTRPKVSDQPDSRQAGPDKGDVYR